MAAFIATQRDRHGVPCATTCRALQVSPAWFYKWRHGDASVQHARREQLAVEVKRLFAKHRGTYGSPRITADLRDDGWRVSRNTVATVMAELGLVARGRRKRKQTTRAGRGRWRAPDLIGRQFSAPAINRKWYGDGTEITTDEGKLFLDSVLDMGSRRIVGYALGVHHDADLAYDALAMAVAVRGGKPAITEVIMHTDQGSEYTAGSFRDACTRVGVTQSMGRVGSALDNAVIESWHSTLEFELRALEHFTTRAQARARIVAWIEEYNHDRRHSSIGMISPDRLRARPPTRGGGLTTGSRPAPAARVWHRPRRGQGQALPGGPRPALTPATGGTDQQPAGAGPKDHKTKIHLDQASAVPGDCHVARPEPSSDCRPTRARGHPKATPKVIVTINVATPTPNRHAPPRSTPGRFSRRSEAVVGE